MKKKNSSVLISIIIFFLILFVLKSCGNSRSSSNNGTEKCRRQGCSRTAVFSDWNQRYCSTHIEEDHYCRYPSCMEKISNYSTNQYCYKHR